MAEIKTYRREMQREAELFFESCFADLGWKYQPDGRHFDIANIQESYMANGCMWCMVLDNKIIGTVAVRIIDKESNYAELKRLYVSKEHQGKGYGSMLFETAINYAVEKGFCKIYADTMKDRSISQHLMRKHGFHEVPRYNENHFAELFFELEINANRH